MAAAYRDAAEATIEHCAQQGYQPGSPVWNEVADILRDESSALKIAEQFRRGTAYTSHASPLNSVSMLGRGCIEWFIQELNERLHALVGPDLQIAVAILLQNSHIEPAASRSGGGPVASQEPALLCRQLPSSVNRYFTGRNDLLDRLQQLHTSGLSDEATAVLYGVPGVGKTQVALNYARRRLGDYDVIWWIHSEDPAVLSAEYAALADALRLAEMADPDQRKKVAAVRRWLDEHGRWLLVFDNIADVTTVTDYLPSHQDGNVLITSRNPTNWEHVAASIHVPLLRRADSVQYLLRRTGQTDMNAASELAGDLGDLPLALEQASLYMGETNASLAAYLNLFRLRRQQLWSDERAPFDHEHNVATTFRLAIEQVQASTLRSERAGVKLLSFCAYLDPNSIPLGFLAAVVMQLPRLREDIATDEVSFRRAVTTLWKYSLIDVTGDFISVHRLVQAVARDQLSAQEQAVLAETAVQAVLATFPAQSSRPDAWGICAVLLPHGAIATARAEYLKVAGRLSIELLTRLSVYLHSRWALRDAEQACRKALNLARTEYGESSAMMAVCLTNLSSVLVDTGRREEGLVLARQALSIGESIYHTNSMEIGQYANNLGMALQGMGNDVARQGNHGQALVWYREGRRCFVRARKTAEEGNNPHGPRCSAFLNNAGRLVHDIGHSEAELGNEKHGQIQYKRAQRYLEKALSLDEVAYGTSSLEVARDCNNLAGLHRVQGNVTLARTYYGRTLDIFDALVGESHPWTLNAKIGLTSVGTQTH